MDFVYLLKHDTENNSEELRYSLRSLRNVPHDQVVIIGEKPDWLTNVLFIPVPQNSTKYQNVNANMMRAIHDDRISDKFVLMNDDFFIMKPLQEIEPLHFGYMQEVLNYYRQRYGSDTPYINNMQSALHLLQSEGHKYPLSYELHVPMVMQRSVLKDIYNNQTSRLFQVRSYYGNHVQVGGRQVSDCKVFIDDNHNDGAYSQDPEKYLAAQTFLSATGGAFKRGIVGEYIRRSFPSPSVYEA